MADTFGGKKYLRPTLGCATLQDPLAPYLSSARQNKVNWFTAALSLDCKNGLATRNITVQLYKVELHETWNSLKPSPQRYRWWRQRAIFTNSVEQKNQKKSANEHWKTVTTSFLFNKQQRIFMLNTPKSPLVKSTKRENHDKHWLPFDGNRTSSLVKSLTIVNNNY